MVFSKVEVAYGMLGFVFKYHFQVVKSSQRVVKTIQFKEGEEKYFEVSRSYASRTARTKDCHPSQDSSTPRTSINNFPCKGFS